MAESNCSVLRQLYQHLSRSVAESSHLFSKANSLCLNESPRSTSGIENCLQHCLHYWMLVLFHFCSDLYLSNVAFGSYCSTSAASRAFEFVIRLRKFSLKKRAPNLATYLTLY